MIATVVCVGIFLLGGKLLLSLYGSNFIDAYPVFIILLIAAIPETLTIASNQVIQSKKKIWLSIFAVNIPRDSLIIISAFFLAPLYGATGIAYAYLLGRILGFITTALCVYKIGL